MTKTTATLIKLKTANGFFAVDETRAAIGKTYLIDTDSIRMEPLQNIASGQRFDCEIVEVVNERGFLPTEILDWPGKVVK